MFSKKLKKIFIYFIIPALIIFFIIYFFNQKKTGTLSKDETLIYNSNIIENVVYTSRDNDGNEYLIEALSGEIDFKNTNIIFLTKVKALIKLKNSENVTIISDYGKYNSENYDTIFSKNVIINYLDNKIIGDYLDFSLERNSMIISKNVIYTNPGNTLKADVINMNIKTKDTKIFMHEEKSKVKMKSNN